MRFLTVAVAAQQAITDLEKVVSLHLQSLATHSSTMVDAVQTATMRQAIAAYQIDLTYHMKNKNLRSDL
jgi:hypothetical protein